jgi:Asp-tRNA(Asn)/Glu-tRNA(Gln) amidotransferase C subunit
VIKESENNAELIYNNCEDIQKLISNSNLSFNEKEKVTNKLTEIFGFLQHQDLHRQKIERVVNYVCEKNDIDKSQYNLAPSAKNIDNTDDNISEDELEALIKQMQS